MKKNILLSHQITIFNNKIYWKEISFLHLKYKATDLQKRNVIWLFMQHPNLVTQNKVTPRNQQMSWTAATVGTVSRDLSCEPHEKG